MHKKVLILGVILLSVAGVSLIFLNPYKVSGEALIDLTWERFTNYLEHAKNHDLENLSKLSHQLSDTCLNPETREDCYTLMDQVHNIGTELKREDFSNIIFDDKQIVLSTDWEPWDDEFTRGYSRSLIFFTRDIVGRPKLLSISPEQFVYVLKDGRTEEELETRLTEMTKDSDQDGLDDEVEACSFSGVAEDCIQTDPTQRDTNNNGWWDGIEILFHEKI